MKQEREEGVLEDGKTESSVCLKEMASEARTSHAEPPNVGREKLGSVSHLGLDGGSTSNFAPTYKSPMPFNPPTESQFLTDFCADRAVEGDFG